MNKFKAGDLALCKATVFFSDNTSHIEGLVYEVREDNVDYFNLFQVDYELAVRPIKKSPTLFEWGNKLPNDIRKRFFKNVRQSSRATESCTPRKSLKFDTMAECLSSAFSWTDSDEGYDYWEVVYESYKPVISPS